MRPRSSNLGENLEANQGMSRKKNKDGSYKEGNSAKQNQASVLAMLAIDNGTSNWISEQNTNSCKSIQ